MTILIRKKDFAPNFAGQMSSQAVRLTTPVEIQTFAVQFQPTIKTNNNDGMRVTVIRTDLNEEKENR